MYLDVDNLDSHDATSAAIDNMAAMMLVGSSSLTEEMIEKVSKAAIEYGLQNKLRSTYRDIQSSLSK